LSKKKAEAVDARKKAEERARQEREERKQAAAARQAAPAAAAPPGKKSAPAPIPRASAAARPNYTPIAMTAGILAVVVGGGAFLLRGNGGSAQKSPPKNVAIAAKPIPKPPVGVSGTPRPVANGEGSKSGSANIEPPVKPSTPPADPQVALKAELLDYMKAFEQYHAKRRTLAAAKNSQQLKEFKAQLDLMMARAEGIDRIEVGLMSDLHREMGILDWFRSREGAARRNWRKALDLNPKNELAAEWLKGTEGAVLRE
jgi:hypothetical protein